MDEKNDRILSLVIMSYIAFVALCNPAMKAEAGVDQKGESDESAVGNPTGKVIIRSVPIECEVSFLDRNIHKSEDQVTIEEVPAGSYPIIFRRGDMILKAELNVQVDSTLLVNGRFRRGKALITSGISVGKDGAPMVLIPAGEFQMGSHVGEPDEEPVHTVYIDAFYMDIYEVTNALYGKFMDATGHEAPRYWDDPKCNAPDQPVVGVSWHDAKAYCEWAGKRLPTEAEWEKAARGGLVGKIYPWGDDIPEERTDVPQVTGTGEPTGTFPVGSFIPNGYGLHDMGGNAWEWCADWYSEDYYAKSPHEDPTGPVSGDTRIMRGGSWFANIYTPLPVSYRYHYDPKNTSNLIGFRCVK